MNGFSVIGKKIPKIDALSKVLGEAKFATDIYLPSMLHGKVLRSTHPHARILRIDTEKAKRLKGIKTIITSKDVSDVKYGALVMDMGIFARGKVRYIGEAVAAVAAIDEDTASEALELIQVDYEELPSVFDPMEAMLPGAPTLHEDLKNYVTLFPRTERSMSGNVNYHAVIHQGDIETGISSSEIIIEDTYKTPKVHQCYLEPHTCVAAFDSDGRVTVWTTTQRPHVNQAIISSVLELPISKIRVIPCHVGGGFGGKNRTLVEPICVALTQKAKLPVRLSLTREEEFTSTTTRHPTIIKIKMGVKRDGTLVACQMDLIYDAGAYAPTPNAVWLGAVTAAGPYRISHVRIETFSVYTNKMMSGAFRGYGTPQVTFARESHVDRIAHELNMDPVEIRLKNCFQKGNYLPTGQKLVSVNIKDTILRAAERIEWNQAKKRGNKAMGISCGFTPCGGFATSCIIRMNQDGTAVISSGAMDMGQGLKTVLAQIVAEELGIEVDDITVISGDTDSTPFDVGIFGDRGTHTTGLAAKMAAMDAKTQIFDLAAAQMEANREDLDIRDHKVFVKGSSERSLSLKDLLAGSVYKKGGPIIGKASINPDTLPMDIKIVQGAASKFFSTYTFATNIVEVEMDPDAGRLCVLKAVGSQDCGTLINPDGAEGQIDGGMAIGLGYGLFEEMLIKEGQVINPNLLDYRMPTALDMPTLDRIIVESYDENGPFGAKGVGNSSVINMAPAIANAIYHATRVRIKELPITPEKILEGLKEKED